MFTRNARTEIGYCAHIIAHVHETRLYAALARVNAHTISVRNRHNELFIVVRFVQYIRLAGHNLHAFAINLKVAQYLIDTQLSAWYGAARKHAHRAHIFDTADKRTAQTEQFACMPMHHNRKKTSLPPGLSTIVQKCLNVSA
jgi:hypothetical protein